MANRSSAAFSTGDSWIGSGSTALLRGMGVLGVGAVGLAGIGLSSMGTLLFSQVVGLWSGVNLAAAVAVGLVVCLVLAYTYTCIAAAVPRAGADYILASRVLNAPLAFVASWVFVLFCGLLVGNLLGLFVKEIVPLFSQIAVLIFGSTGSLDLIKIANQPQVIISAGTLLTVVAFVGLFVPQRLFQRLMLVGGGLGVLAWGAILVSFFFSQPGAFASAWNQAHSVESYYATVIPAAQALGFQNAIVPNFSLAGLSMGLVVFFGFISATYLGGDVRKPESAILGGSALALLVAALVFIAAAVLAVRVIPADWLAAQSFLSLNLAYAGAATPYITYYAGLLTPNLPLLLLIYWGWVFSFITLIQAFMVFIGRILLAWADDGLLPEGMTYVHPHYRSPLVTLLVAAVLVQLGLVIFFAGSAGNLVARLTFFGAVTLLVPVTAVTFFPFLKKTWFQASPAFVQRKIGPLPVITLTGSLVMAYLVFLLIGPLLSVGGLQGISLVDLLVFGGMVLSGGIWYVSRIFHLRAHGVRLEELMRSLPRSS